ncbi:MAG TPA: TrkA family potassium uptake protein [Armatimonadota bacterium]|jgi:trk system potassium uptake protein TrkA
MKVVVLGCGRVGSQLSMSLSNAGHEVSVIDKDREAFERLGHSFKGRKFVGLGIDEDVLRAAGLPEADAFVTVAYGDNTNVMAAQIATMKFKVPRVLCRMKDPSRARAYRDMGVYTFASTLLASGVIEDFILGTPWQSVEHYLGLPEPTEEPG